MNEYFLEQALKYEPIIHQRICKAVSYGTLIPENDAWFGYQFQQKNAPEAMGMGDICYLDFGEHLVGYLSFEMKYTAMYPDAPVKLNIKFAENTYELAYDFRQYEQKAIGLSPAWLQEQTLYVDEPGEVRLSRRYAFRYVKISVEHTNVPIRLDNFVVRAVTSADRSKCKPLQIEDKELQKIDEVACKTLANCMQRVYEDGPKRDRRLWLGDLRIQALTDYYVFKNTDLVKKCLYLFAAYMENGNTAYSCIYENSKGSEPSDMQFEDYALLFVVGLCEYYEHTQDKKLINELYELAANQLQLACDRTENGIVKDGWLFIDWCEGLEKRTSFQGVLLYTLDKMTELCCSTEREEHGVYWAQKLNEFRVAARTHLYNEEKKLFVNLHDNHQASVHAQVWMVLGGVLTGEEAKDLMKRTIGNQELVQVVSPYMHHYVVEALIKADLKEEAMQYIKTYWGCMVELGADTYWEVFVPGDFSVSPYGDTVMNSSCHAWSCSAAYFIRKYLNE